MVRLRAGGMTKLKAHTALAEDPSYTPSTHIGFLTTDCCVSEEQATLPDSEDPCTHRCTDPYAATCMYFFKGKEIVVEVREKW